MPHTRKKNKKKIPKNYIPIENSHCDISKLIDAIYYQIKINWITKDEFEEVYKQIMKKLKND